MARCVIRHQPVRSEAQPPAHLSRHVRGGVVSMFVSAGISALGNASDDARMACRSFGGCNGRNCLANAMGGCVDHARIFLSRCWTPGLPSSPREEARRAEVSGAYFRVFLCPATCSFILSVSHTTIFLSSVRECSLEFQ